MATKNKTGADGEDTIQSYDSTEVLTDIGFYKTLFRLYWNSRKICIPAIVKELHDDDGLITVKPLVNMSKNTVKGREGIERADVKVWPVQFAHGGYRMSCPIYVGDTGYIVSGDRFAKSAIEKNNQLVKESVERYEDSPNKGPQDLEVFDTNEWEYGFFIPSSWVNEKDLPEDLKGKFAISNVQEGDKSAFITIDQDGNVVIHGAKLDVEAETGIVGGLTVDGKSDLLGDVNVGGNLDVTGDTRLHGNLDVDGDTTLQDLEVKGDAKVDGNLNVEGTITIASDEEDGSAAMVETTYVTGVQGNNLTTWKGKVMRTGGEEGEPIPIPGGGGGGGDMKADNVSLAIENGEMSIKGYKSEDSSGSLANSMFGGDAVTGDVVVRPGKSSDPSFAKVGAVTPGEGIEFAIGQDGPEIKLALESGGGINIGPGTQGKKKISSSCVSEIQSIANVTFDNARASSLALNRVPTTKDDGTSKYEIRLTGNIALGGGGGISSVVIESNAVTGQGVDNDSPATKISYSVDGGNKQDVTLIPDDAVNYNVEICVGVTYDKSTKKLKYQKRVLVFRHGILMNVTTPEPPNDEVEVLEAVDHVPEEP